MPEASEQALVAVVILNWNNPDDTLACLHSVAAVNYPAMVTIVVDNGSTDDSVARVRAGFPDVEVIETGGNLGYAGGNNVGIRHALALEAPYVLVLNNDVLLEPDSLTLLVAEIEAGVDVGVVAPLIADAADPGTVWALGAELDLRTGSVNRLYCGEGVAEMKGRPSFAVIVAPGSAMLLRREVIEQVGFLDEAFFLYYEEVDWALRVREAGFRVRAVPGAIVFHAVSSTLGQENPLVDYYMTRNQLVFLTRHWHGADRLRVLPLAFVSRLATALAFSINHRSPERLARRNAILHGLRDAVLGRTGQMASS